MRDFNSTLHPIPARLDWYGIFRPDGDAVMWGNSPGAMRAKLAFWGEGYKVRAVSSAEKRAENIRQKAMSKIIELPMRIRSAKYAVAELSAL